MRQKLTCLFAALIGVVLASVPLTGSAQQIAGGGDGPFRGFSGNAFGFDPTQFYRFASGPDGFLPWHQDRRSGSTRLIYRVLDIDQIRTYITVVDIFDNTRVPVIVVNR